MINCSVRTENSQGRGGQRRRRDCSEEDMNWEGMEEYYDGSGGSLNGGLEGLGKLATAQLLLLQFLCGVAPQVPPQYQFHILFPQNPLSRLSTLPSICRTEWALQFGMKLLIRWMIVCVCVCVCVGLITILQCNRDRMVNWISLFLNKSEWQLKAHTHTHACIRTERHTDSHKHIAAPLFSPIRHRACCSNAMDRSEFRVLVLVGFGHGGWRLEISHSEGNGWEKWLKTQLENNFDMS